MQRLLAIAIQLFDCLSIVFKFVRFVHVVRFVDEFMTFMKWGEWKPRKMNLTQGVIWYQIFCHFYESKMMWATFLLSLSACLCVSRTNSFKCTLTTEMGLISNLFPVSLFIAIFLTYFLISYFDCSLYTFLSSTEGEYQWGWKLIYFLVCLEVIEMRSTNWTT